MRDTTTDQLTEEGPRSLIDILDAVEKVARDRDRVSVENVLEAMGRAGPAAFIFLPALIAATPLSGIPGLSAFCGIVIFLVSAQAVWGRTRLWLPKRFMRREVEGDRLFQGLEKARRALAFLDRHTHKRMAFLTTGVGAKLLFAVCMLGGMMMPFLEVIPFSASIVASAVLFLTVAILTLDGALVVAAGVFVACAVLAVRLVLG